MTSINRQIESIKAAHPRSWASLDHDSRRTWLKLIDAGASIKQTYRQLRLDQCELCKEDVPKGQKRCAACEQVFSPFKGMVGR